MRQAWYPSFGTCGTLRYLALQRPWASLASLREGEWLPAGQCARPGPFSRADYFLEPSRADLKTYCAGWFYVLRRSVYAHTCAPRPASDLLTTVFKQALSSESYHYSAAARVILCCPGSYGGIGGSQCEAMPSALFPTDAVMTGTKATRSRIRGHLPRISSITLY